MIIKTTKQFKKELELSLPDLTLISDYTGNKNKVLVKDSLGIEYKSIPSDLLKGHTPGPKAAVDMNKYFIIKAKNVHGDKYDYRNVKFKKLKEKVEIICPRHNNFRQIPKDHLKGHGCLMCAWEFGVWRQSHWQQKANISTNFSGFKLYFLKLENEKEQFLKVGITFREVKNRIKPLELKYKCTILNIITDDCEKIYKLEKTVKRNLKKYRYNPEQKFPGMTECYQLNSFPTINNLITL